MAGYRALGDTLRRDYARREIKLRGELRQAITEVLGEYWLCIIAEQRT